MAQWNKMVEIFIANKIQVAHSALEIYLNSVWQGYIGEWLLSA